MTTPELLRCSVPSLSIWYERFLPEQSVGGWSIEHFTIDEQTAAFSRLRETVTRGRERAVDPGEYTKLTGPDGGIVMSNTLIEFETNHRFIARATGDVLIAGLGLGLVARQLLLKRAVKSVTIVEKEPAVIKMASPFVADERLHIIEGSIFDFRAGGRRWDSILFDIWPSICESNRDEMARLRRRFARSWTRRGPRICWSESLLASR